MLPGSTTPVLDLALAFTDQIVRNYTNTQAGVIYIRLRNAREEDPRICHSHDVCDANQAMIDAMQTLGETLDLDDPRHEEWADQAWCLAKAGNFIPARIQHVAQTLGVDR